MKALIPVLAVLALVGISTPQAQAASVSYSLNFDTCTGTCGTGPFGTVTLTQTVADVISVNVTLLNGARFVNTGVGPAFGFDMNGVALTSANISGLTSGFSFLATSQTYNGSLGTFDYGIKCDVCGPGGSNPNAGPLNFTITKSGITLSSFTNGSGGYIFAADIMGANGNTGGVGAPPDTLIRINEVPEPMTMSLLGLGLAGMGLLKRARRK